MGQNVIPNILTIRVWKREYWLEIKMYVLERQNFDPLPLIADIVRYTQYIF